MVVDAVWRRPLRLLWVLRLSQAVKRLAVHNQRSKPFVWTARACDIPREVIPAHRPAGSPKNKARDPAT